MTLVVRSSDEALRLKRARARVRGAHVDWFPPDLRPRVVMNTPRVSKDLARACVETRPTRSDFEAMWSAIDFAWQNARQPGDFVSISRVVDALPDQNVPLRVPWAPTEPWVEAEKLLRRVRGLSFVMRDGHMLYDDGAGTSGRISCRTSAFGKFVRRVLKERPRDLNAARRILERA